MKNKALQFFKYALPLIIAFLLLKYFVFKEISFTNMVNEFKKADFKWVFFSGVALLLAHLSRAYRWQLLLNPLGYRPALPKTFIAVMVGYFANLILPRMGEVTRCGLMLRMERVPVNTAFGTVVAERIFDLIMLFLLFCATFVLEFNRLSNFFIDFFAQKFGGLSHLSQNFYILLACIALLGLAMLVALYHYRARFSQNAFYLKIQAFIKGVLDGMLSVIKLERPWAFALHTVLIWAGYYFASYALTFALPDAARLSWLAGLTILMMGSLGMAAPVQGGTGPFHVLVSGALMLYGWTYGQGIILATFIWASQTLLTLVSGGICFVISLFLNKPTTEKVVVNL
jgi:hypothetical protein